MALWAKLKNVSLCLWFLEVSPFPKVPEGGSEALYGKRSSVPDAPLIQEEREVPLTSILDSRVFLLLEMVLL